MTTIHNEHDAFDAMLCELHRARRLYPFWPVDIVHAAAIVSEEAGEVVKGCNDFHFHGKGSVDAIVTEAIQLGAMCLRFLCDTPALRGDVAPIVAISTSEWTDAIADQDAEIQRLRSEVARLTILLQSKPLPPVHFVNSGEIKVQA